MALGLGMQEGGQQGTEVGGDVEAQVVCNEGPVGGGTQRRNAFAILMESRGRKANAETSSPSSNRLFPQPLSSVVCVPPSVPPPSVA